jgi:hypothetical protein
MNILDQLLQTTLQLPGYLGAAKLLVQDCLPLAASWRAATSALTTAGSNADRAKAEFHSQPKAIIFLPASVSCT